MRSKEEMLAILEGRVRLRPKQKPPTASERAAQRFDVDRKPTEAIAQDAASHNRALLSRLQAVRIAAEPSNGHQALIDSVWERTKAAETAQEALGRTLCHRGPGDPDWAA